MEGEFKKVKLGDMYVKDFKIVTVKDSDNFWRVRREVTLTNDEKDAIPIIKEEAQGIAKLLDKSAILVSLESKGE